MNNLLRVFDYFYLKAQTDIVVNIGQRKDGVIPKNTTQNHFTAGLLFNFLARFAKAFSSDQYSQFVLNLFRDPQFEKPWNK